MIIVNESFTVDDYTSVLNDFTKAQDHLISIVNKIEDEYKKDIIDDVDKDILSDGLEETQRILNQIKEFIERG